MARLSLDERLNRIEDKSLSVKIKDLEMKSDIMCLIIIQERNWKCAVISHI